MPETNLLKIEASTAGMAYIGVGQVISYLREHIAGPLLELDGSFEPIEKDGGESLIGVVDGGSGVVWNGTSFLIGAHRAGFRIYGGDKLLKREVDEVSVRIAQNQKHLDSIREEDELKMTEKLAGELEDGIFLIDGVLPDIELPAAAIGISKSTSRSLNGYPLTPFIMRKGKELFPDKPWCYSSEAGIFALFHPLSKYLFRLEFSLDGARSLLKELLRYCNDPIYLGYPYPLALIHNDVAITYEIMADILYSLQREEPSLLQMERFHRRLDENLW